MWSQWLQDQKIDRSNRIKHEKWLVAVFKKNEMGKAVCFVETFPLFVWLYSLVRNKTVTKLSL